MTDTETNTRPEWHHLLEDYMPGTPIPSSWPEPARQAAQELTDQYRLKLGVLCRGLWSKSEKYAQLH